MIIKSCSEFLDWIVMVIAITVGGVVIGETCQVLGMSMPIIIGIILIFITISTYHIIIKDPFVTRREYVGAMMIEYYHGGEFPPKDVVMASKFSTIIQEDCEKFWTSYSIRRYLRSEKVQHLFFLDRL